MLYKNWEKKFIKKFCEEEDNLIWWNENKEGFKYAQSPHPREIMEFIREELFSYGSFLQKRFIRETKKPTKIDFYGEEDENFADHLEGIKNE